MQTKTQKLTDCQIKVSAEAGRFSGYASVFNSVDSYGDTILPGAYADTLKNYQPKMFVNHDSWELPVGKWLDIKEDDVGLFVTGEFTPGMGDADNAYAALKHGTIDGLSIGYVLQSADSTPRTESMDGGQLITRVSRLIEISIVTFPADNGARISSVKSEIEKLETIRDFERFLRDSGSFSKGTATQLIAQCKTIFGAGEPPPHIDVTKLTARIQQLNQKLQA